MTIMRPKKDDANMKAADLRLYYPALSFLVEAQRRLDSSPERKRTESNRAPALGRAA